MGVLYISRLALLLVGAALFSTAGATTLTTTLGDVTGAEKTMFRKQVQVFYGIPYAKNPARDRRFRAPQPADAWGSQPRDGTVKPPTCWQTVDTRFDRFEGVEQWNPPTDMSEDCLYLNVWRRTPEDDDKPKTIMVWIHGGGFVRGSALLDVTEGSQLAARENVIVVTIAYRLGPLGFMYLPNDQGVAENAGLLDQQMAIQWVKDNAENLGGDPNEITLFGQGVGAASAGFHLFAPSSRDLFNNVIMQSGSPTAYWVVKDADTIGERVKKLAANVSCPFSLGDQQALSCLRDVDPEVLTSQQWILTDKWDDIPLAPIVDEKFFPEHPEDMLAKGDVKSTEVIIGYNLNEGIIYDIYGFPDDIPFEDGGKVADDPYFNIMREVANHDDDLVTEVLKVYSQEFKGASKRRMRIVDAGTGDVFIKCPAVKFARGYAPVGQVYLYSFEQKLKSNPWPGWMGVPHGYEIEVVFGLPFDKGSQNPKKEKLLNKEVMDLWTNFAKKGIPKTSEVEWPAYTLDKEEFVKIDAKGTRPARRPRSFSCPLWEAQDRS